MAATSDLKMNHSGPPQFKRGQPETELMKILQNEGQRWVKVGVGSCLLPTTPPAGPPENSSQININIPDSSRPLAITHVYSNISHFLYPLRHAAPSHFLCLCSLSPSFSFSLFKLIVNRDAAGWELSKQQDNNNCLLSPRIHTFITGNTHWSIWLLLTVSNHLTNL